MRNYKKLEKQLDKNMKKLEQMKKRLSGSMRFDGMDWEEKGGEKKNG